MSDSRPSTWDDARAAFRAKPRRWLVTGGAGFIGSHLVEELLALGQTVRVLDNLVTGKRANVDAVLAAAGRDAVARCEFIEGDIADAATAARACAGIELVLHQAALGSVPRSIADPRASHRANVDGFLEMLIAARDAGVARFVYASSSSVYGDEPNLPKVEARVGRVLSPYAATKAVNELYAGVFQRTYGLQCIGLRYFNVFGPRQDPDGPYAAVIPRWVKALLRNEPCTIFGDGETSRDFCYVKNAVQANLLSAIAPASSTDAAYNVAYGARTTLTSLFGLLRDGLAPSRPQLAGRAPEYADFRKGDVRHSLADIAAARDRLGYAPTHDVARGIGEALAWYVGEYAG
ncbi:MAG TPA: SDR family oxidoreductase [Candidatus Binatia bacterium]|nr:SDR family oxidoreductase [Candidatus Binatia bacterium]